MVYWPHITQTNNQENRLCYWGALEGFKIGCKASQNHYHIDIANSPCCMHMYTSCVVTGANLLRESIRKYSTFAEMFTSEAQCVLLTRRVILYMIRSLSLYQNSDIATLIKIGLWQHPSYLIALGILVAHTVLARVWQSLLNNLCSFINEQTLQTHDSKIFIQHASHMWAWILFSNPLSLSHVLSL